MNNSNCSFDSPVPCADYVNSSSSFLDALDEFKSGGGFSKRPQPLISNEAKAIVDIYVNCVLFMATSLIGIVANVVNIIVYWRQGFKDGITIGFFALSCSDFMLVFMTFCTSVWYSMKKVLLYSDVDFQSIHYVSSATLRNMFYSTSSDLTAFLSMERCFCVVRPFKVKVIFSKARSTAIIVAIVSFHFLCFLPLFVTHQLRWQPIGRGISSASTANGSNLTGSTTAKNILRVYFLPHRKQIEKVNTLVSGLVTPSLSQAIVTVCIVILIQGLRASSRFRKSVANASGSVQTSTATTDSKKQGLEEETQNGQDMSGGGVNKGNARGQLTGRDARLVKTMILLVIIFTMSNVPLLAITYAKNIVPELNFRRAYHNTATTAYSIIYLMSSINATANMFVYYNTSTRFRQMARALLFSCKCICKAGSQATTSRVK